MTLYQFISKVFETKHTSQVLSMFYHVHVPQEFGCHFTLTCIHLIPIFFSFFFASRSEDKKRGNREAPGGRQGPEGC